MNAPVSKGEQLPAPVRKQGQELILQRPLPPVIAEFQPDAVELEEKVPPKVARLTLYGVTALIAAAIAWASLASVDQIVTATGKLVTTEPTIVVQPLETSIIRSIDVNVGDVVQAGQRLASLDATFSQADVDQRRTQFAALDAQVDRIEAELGGRDFSLVAGDTPDERLQLELFGQRRAFYMAQLHNFDQQIAAQAAAIAAGKDRETILLDRRATLGEIEQARQTLHEREVGSLLNLLLSRDARLDVDANLAQLHGATMEAQHTLAKLRADRQAFIEDFRRATMEQLVELRSQRDAVGEELKKMELRRTMVALTAPADAVVLDLAQRSIGSVVREAEPILTLVPLNVPLEAEVSVNARDIGRIAADDSARMKFDAFPFQKFGTVDGAVRTISRDAFTPDPQEAASGGLPYFKARIKLSDIGLENDGEPVRLLPGMAVTAEIKAGRRKVISYFLYPLIRGLDQSIREP